MKSIALLGECLIELNGMPFGPLQQSFGGDSLNTALYLARLASHAINVKYVTAVGIDALSEGMLQHWRDEGIDTAMVVRDTQRLPGLYLIEVDPNGERSFLYWRGESAARYLLQHRDFDRVAHQLAQADMIYLTGVSLAILPPRDREKLTALLVRLAASGVTIAFDSNYRKALWASADEARTAIASIVPMTRLMFATFDDEQRLWGDHSPEATLSRLLARGAQLAIVKDGAAGCLLGDGATIARVAAKNVSPVVDTTGAGDAFNAGFLAGWVTERRPEDCCRIGNALAATVIQHRGAIIPPDATPLFTELLGTERLRRGIDQGRK